MKQKRMKFNKGMALFTIRESLARLILEPNFDRKFTAQEIKRVKFAFNDPGRAYMGIFNAIIDAGADALDNTDGKWDALYKE